MESPDLYPNENLWDYTGKSVEEQNSTLTTDLWVAVKNAWEAVLLII